MNIIGALDVPTEGEYILGGEGCQRDERRPASAQIRNKMIGFIFQQYNLLPKLNLLENVELPLLYAGVSVQERKERALKSLAKVGLEENGKICPTSYPAASSRGFPLPGHWRETRPLILADEPTGALDSRTSREVLNF